MKITILNREWIRNAKSEVIGINLGYDYAAEHEHGIKDIRDAFGIEQQRSWLSKLVNKKPEFGIKARIAKKFPQMRFFQRGEFAGIGFHDGMKSTDDYVGTALETKFTDGIKKLAWPGRKPDNDFIAYWDEHSFLFVTNNVPNYEAVKKAFVQKDIAFYLGGKGFLSSGGLHIVRASAVDAGIDTVMTLQDENAYNLREQAKKTKIADIISKAGLKFHALTPGWKTTEGEVWFHLIPMDQTLYKTGWYTIEELKQWTEGTGPVIKTEEVNTKDALTGQTKTI